jgi:hypothetical protein
VLARIPAPDGDVEATAERDRIVHHHDLLVVRRADGKVVVEAEADAPRRAPAQ